MPIEDVFTITGRGTVATGRVEERSSSRIRRSRNRWINRRKKREKLL